MWHELIGTPQYAAGANGTVTVDRSGVLLLVIAHASAGAATVTIFGGAAIPIINGASPTVIALHHTLFAASQQTSQAIVFTNTDQYFVHWVRQGNA